MDPLDAIFQNLDRWRHLPAYQLERRADIFFSVYLRGLVEELKGVPLEEEVIPELPLERDLLEQPKTSAMSVKVDYALFAKDRSRVFLVELKTDMHSRNERQDRYLAEAKKQGFKPLVEGVCRVVRSTKEHERYHHLVSTLGRLGCLTMPDDIGAFLFPKRRRGLGERLRGIRACEVDASVEVVYVQPRQPTGPGPDTCIDFAQFAAMCRASMMR